MRKLLGLALCAVLAFPVFADARGDEIAKKYFDLSKAADTRALATMTLIDSSGARKIRKLEIFYKEGKEGRNAFIVFSEPADVAGTKFLVIAHRGSESEQRLWLPALKKTRKISGAGKDGEFVNSDLYFYDLEDRNFSDATYTFISENETIADKAFEGMKFWKIEMRPKDPAAPYSRVVAWINMADSFAYRLDCFGRKDGTLLKTISCVQVESIKGHLLPTQMLVVNAKKGSKTLLAMGDIKVDQGISDEIFTEKNLEK